MKQGRASGGGYKHAVAEVKMSVVKRPVQEGGASEQGRTVGQGGTCLKYKGIRGRGGFDVTGQCEVEGADYHGVRKDGSVCSVLSGVEVIPPRESISRPHVSPWGDSPNEIKVLKKKRPASLSAGEFARVFEVGQILVIGEDRNWVRSPLQVLFPFNKGEDNSEELPIIYVIIVFSQGEGLGKVGTGVKVHSLIRLHQDSTSSQEGGICHESEGASDIRDA